MKDNLNTRDPIDFEGDGEISLSEVVGFLRNSWQSIAVAGFSGVLVGVAYIVLTPNSYEAVSQIRLAQVAAYGSTSTSGAFGVALEDSAALISRMQLPSNATLELFDACGVASRSDRLTWFYKAIKLTPVKGAPNIIELRALAPTPGLAKSCANTFFEHIKNSQMNLAAILIEEAKAKLAADDARIESSRKLIANAHQLGAAMPAAYLAARDELNFYLADREKMIDYINVAKSRGTSLASPIYTFDKPTSPNKTAGILLGLLGGAVLGVLLALGRRFWQKIKTKIFQESKE